MVPLSSEIELSGDLAMIDCVTWETAHLFGDAWISHHRLRHRLFVDRRGWEVPTYNSLEYDQFDTPAAVYLLWRDEAGQARGVARLIPTERPYMLKEIWPHMVDKLPSSPNVWEATRIGVDRDLDPKTRNRVCSELVAGCLEYGLRHGISRYIFLMPLVIIRSLLVRAGCPVVLLGEPTIIDNLLTAVAEVKISKIALAEVRRRKVIAGPVLNTETAPLKKAA
jgi:acyl homoserine lactone synthase